MKRFRKRWLLLALALLAVGGWLIWKSLNKPVPGSEFRTAQVTRGDLSEVITANGVLNPVRVVSVGTQVSGTVSELHADYNSRVQQGQLLLKLDPSITLILIEHDMDVALRVAQWVTMMHDGRVIVEGTPDDIRGNQTVHDLYLGSGLIHHE